MPRKRVINVLLVTAVAAGPVAIVGAGSPATAAFDAADAKLAQSAALRLAPAPARGAGDLAYRAGTDARRRAGAHAAVVPLPDGGNVNGVRWEEVAGTVTAAEIDTVVEYNAGCQWLRAWADGREAATAARVLAEVAAWPSLRGSETAGMLAEVAGDASRASRSALLEQVLGDCERTHAREVAYASRLGLKAST